MPDIAAIQAVLASIKTATEIARLIKSADVSLQEADHKMKMAELVGALADAKTEIAGIQELILEKDRTIRRLQEAADVTARLKYEAPFYWLVDGNPREGPYCQQCRDSGGKLVRLQDVEDRTWMCKTCKNYFHQGQRQPPQRFVEDWEPR